MERSNLKNKNINLFNILLLIFFLHSCASRENQVNNSSYLDKGYEFEKLLLQVSVDDLEKYKKKRNLDSISLIFTKEFNDSIQVFYNNILYKEFKLSNDTLSTKTPYNVIKVPNYGNLKNHILIKLLNKKKMINFSYDPRISFYEISRYKGLWYITSNQGD